MSAITCVVLAYVLSGQLNDPFPFVPKNKPHAEHRKQAVSLQQRIQKVAAKDVRGGWAKFSAPILLEQRGALLWSLPALESPVQFYENGSTTWGEHIPDFPVINQYKIEIARHALSTDAVENERWKPVLAKIEKGVQEHLAIWLPNKGLRAQGTFEIDGRTPATSTMSMMTNTLCRSTAHHRQLLERERHDRTRLHKRRSRVLL